MSATNHGYAHNPAYVLDNPFAGRTTPRQREEFCKRMSNRREVGFYRYEAETHAFRNRDQEEAFGPDWRHAYMFLDTPASAWLTGMESKSDRYVDSGNRELLIDVGNYAMYYLLTGEDDYSLRYCMSVLGWAVREFYHPTHPRAHYVDMDQGIDGPGASGSNPYYGKVPLRIIIQNRYAV